MPSTNQVYNTDHHYGEKTNSSNKLTLAAIGVTIVLTIAVLGLAVATLIKVNQTISTETATTTSASLNSVLAESIRIQDVMGHLNELQRIATANNGNRAVSTSGFNQTLDYITNSLSIYTNYNVKTSFFTIRQFALVNNPILISSINGVVTNYTYSNDLSAADFYHIQFSIAANFASFQQISVIPGVGCSDDEWSKASVSPAGKVALVKRGICAFSDKGALAAKYNVQALLIYNDGASPDRISPIAIGLGQQNNLPALFLSYPVGQALADAALNTSSNTGVRLIINVENLPLSPIGNICADTPTGDATQTIVVGSHSDSNRLVFLGSGSAANLGLAIALARLFQTSSYEKYKYRIRFCWWGAEEIGLLGSDDHVKQAKVATAVGERLQDYLINLNYDMLGSPNYIFGIYDGRTANDATPTQALPGSNKISALFRGWFEGQKLPWDFTDFSGRSDYGPFLAEGIVAGGLFSGGDDIKTQEQRDRYDRLLGQGAGGIAGAIQDPCYHQPCDSIQNINPFAYEKMVQAAAYALEYLARQGDLQTYLYPDGRPTRTNGQSSRQKYDSINEYFRMPYL
ncbi:unnamed protein product [Adineta ricciae]|uniref:Uncharacterized protein n=1 Tax=Adineta ricciae TaxID=249248 RepID=A0A814F966_ADIRI|nr:unnamed protein product [Adineta ricciae]CAF1389886.1 unnamed protein product [Adineta ricciae]